MNIRTVYECPHCNAPLTSKERPEACPKCNYDFGTATIKYKAPLTLYEQREKLLDKAGHRNAVLELEADKAKSILNDALNIIELIAVKKASPSDISTMVAQAKRIGEIATKYEEFLNAGGRLTITEGDLDESKKTGVREDTP